MIDSVIFDLDGTLVNSMGVWAESDMIFLNNHGHEDSRGDNGDSAAQVHS